jgi:hypothetical protein
MSCGLPPFRVTISFFERPARCQQLGTSINTMLSTSRTFTERRRCIPSPRGLRERSTQGCWIDLDRSHATAFKLTNLHAYVGLLLRNYLIVEAWNQFRR